MRRTSFACRLSWVALAFALSACASVPGLQSDHQRVVEMDTVSGDFLQGIFAASRKDYETATRSFDRAAAEVGSTQTIGNAFRFALASGDMETARRYARIIVAATEKPDTDDYESFAQADLPRLTLGVLAFNDGDAAEALAVLDAPFSTPLGKSVSSLLKAWLLYDTDGLEPAVVQMGEGGDGVFLGFNSLHLAFMLELAGETDAAEVAYGKALKGAAADFAVVGYSSFLEANRTPDKARAFYGKLAAERGYLRRVGRMGLARLEAPLDGESEEFIRIAQDAPSRLVPDSRAGMAMALTNFAWVAYDQAVTQQQAAERAGFKSLAVSFDIPLAMAQLAAVLDDGIGAADYIVGAIAGAYENEEMAVAADERVPVHSWLYNYAVIDHAHALEALGRDKQAMRLLKRYLKQDALAPDVALSLAELNADNDRFDDAISYASTAIDVAGKISSDDTRGDNLWRYYFARGAILSDAGDWPAAKADLEKALALSPDQPLVLNYLGYSFVERGERLDEAFAMIEKALAEMPNSGAITDSLGWAHFQRGDYEQAVDYLERAVALVPSDDTVTDHLGDAYWFVGRKTEARYEWRRVLTLPEGDAGLRDAVERKLAGDAPTPGALTVSTSN